MNISSDLVSSEAIWRSWHHKEISVQTLTQVSAMWLHEVGRMSPEYFLKTMLKRARQSLHWPYTLWKGNITWIVLHPFFCSTSLRSHASLCQRPGEIFVDYLVVSLTTGCWRAWRIQRVHEIILLIVLTYKRSYALEDNLYKLFLRSLPTHLDWDILTHL